MASLALPSRHCVLESLPLTIYIYVDHEVTRMFSSGANGPRPLVDVEKSGTNHVCCQTLYCLNYFFQLCIQAR